MTTRSIARRTRAVIALAASTALLGLAACGADGGGTGTASPESGTQASDGGGEQSQPADDGGSTAEEDGGSSRDADDDAPSSEEEDEGDERAEDEPGTGSDDAVEGGTEASGERTRILLVTELEVDDTAGEGPLTLPAEQLASMLGAPFDATAECTEELTLAPGGTAGCMGPGGFEQPEPTQEWTAQAVRIPHKEEPVSGSQDAVLFSTGAGLPDAADDLLDEDVVLTGVGFGSAFGIEPLSAEQVAESALDTLTSEFAYVPVLGMAEWSEVSCEDGLDFARFETVDCEAITATGETWDLAVAPGTYADNDQGLLIGIESPPQG